MAPALDGRSSPRFVQANGVRFALLEQGTGPLVLLLHGFPDTAHTWDAVLPVLAARGFHVVAPFMRGYAPTAIPDDGAYDSDTLGRDVIALIEALGESSAVVVGHDWGAAAAFSAATIAPERVAQLITVGIPHPASIRPSPAVLWTVRHFFTLRLPGAAARTRAHDFAHIDELVARWSPAWSVPPDETRAVKEAFAGPGRVEAALGYYRAMKPTLPASHRKRIGVPATAFAGTDDNVDPVVFDRAASWYTAGYEVVRVPGGHFMHREHPEPFIRELVRVLGIEPKGIGTIAHDWFRTPASCSYSSLELFCVSTPSTSEPFEATEPHEALPPGAVVGRYVILQLLGQGGAGVVYSAYDGELNRKLALKFLRFRGDPEAVSAASHRLRREAKAMARLSHPNVVSIHDVGRVAGHMFLVMDFVAGGTLRHWLEQPRPWRERLDLLCRAGDGLAAAHTAGIVHRDFKPSNVLVDGDQPRVTDFGIAAAERQAPLAPETNEGQPHPPPRARSGRDETVQTEGVLGTVGYLAPEQGYVTKIDARSDQFSFCVTLYEALYGILPFPNDDLLTYLDAIDAGTIRPPPAGARVPRSVHAAIVRGLSAEPDDRFPSMGELLEALRRDRDQPARRRWTLAGAAVVTALVLALVARERANLGVRLCPVPDATLGGAWTPVIRDRIGALFAHAASFGAGAYTPLSKAIDDYAGSVARMREEACVAARVQGRQSETVMTLRLECLDGRARELTAFVQLLASSPIDDKVVGGAAASLGKLSLVGDCADVAALTAPVPSPTRTVVAAVESARAELAEVRALQSLGRYAEAETRASALASRADTIGYAPLIAEVDYALGNAQLDHAHEEQSEKTLRAAIDVADEGKHDLLRGQAYVLLSMVTGRRLGHYDVAIAQGTTALHIARRIGSQSLEADALEQLGMDHGQMGLVEEGLRESTEALAIKERLEGSDSLDLATTHVAVSVALSELGRFDEAEREDRRALAIVELHQGPMHPHAGIYHGNLSVDLVWAGRAEEGVAEADRAMRIARAAVGTEHPDYALAENNKGYALTKLGRFSEARPLNEDAAGIAERVEGASSSAVVYPLVGVGEDLLGLGEPANALPILERATRIADASELDPETMGECHYQLARAVWLVNHDHARAAALARKAVADYGRSPRLAPRAREAEAFARQREGSSP